MNKDNEKDIDETKKVIMPVKIGKSANQQGVTEETIVEKPIEDSTDEDKKEVIVDNKKDTVEETTETQTTTEDEIEDVVSDKIEIDGIVYDLDKSGNAILDGTVAFTKDQIAKMSEEDDNQIPLIAEKSGIIPVDESGNPIEYDYSIEGLAQRESDIFKLGTKEGWNQGFKEFLQSNPDIADIINYKERFGTIDGYTSNVDYSRISLGDDEDELYNIIYAAEIQRGNPKERAKRIADFAKTNNTLKEDAKLSLDYLRKNQEAVITAKKQEELERYKKEVEKEILFYGVDYSTGKEVVVPQAKGSLYDSVIVQGKLKNYQIPVDGINVTTEKGIVKMSRRDIFDYLSKPVKEIDGIYYTQAQLDEISKINDPQEYALRCISNLNGGINTLIKKEMDNQEIKRIKSLKSDKAASKGKSTRVSDNKSTKIVLPIQKRSE